MVNANRKATNQGVRLPYSVVHHHRRAGKGNDSHHVEGFNLKLIGGRHTISEYGIPVFWWSFLKWVILEPFQVEEIWVTIKPQNRPIHVLPPGYISCWSKNWMAGVGAECLWPAIGGINKSESASRALIGGFSRWWKIRFITCLTKQAYVCGNRLRLRRLPHVADGESRPHRDKRISSLRICLWWGKHWIVERPNLSLVNDNIQSISLSV